MDQLLKLFNVDQLLVIAAVLLLMIGFLEPKRFFGIEIDWERKKGETPKAIFPIIAGYLLLALSLARMFLWSH